jgi:hypothetical protein
MKKHYITWQVLDMPVLIDDFIKAREKYNNDVARAARIESELSILSSDAIDTMTNFTGIDPLQLIVELRDDTFINNLLKDIARCWRYAPITKAQRALLGKNTMRALKTIYINL